MNSGGLTKHKTLDLFLILLCHDFYFFNFQQSLKVLKSLFKKLDPTVVKSPNDVNGEIELSFKYDTKRQLLLVKVIRCRGLCAKDIRTKASDPYVKVFGEFCMLKKKALLFIVVFFNEHTA